MTDEQPEHRYFHDLESLLHVLVYTRFTMSGVGEKRISTSPNLQLKMVRFGKSTDEERGRSKARPYIDQVCLSPRCSPEDGDIIQSSG